MLKRLIALIGALVLVFTLTLPCFAEEQYDYTDELLYSDFTSFDGLILFLQGEIRLTIFVSAPIEQLDVFYFTDFIFCGTGDGFVVYTNGIELPDNYSFYADGECFFRSFVYDKNSGLMEFYDTAGMLINYFVPGQDLITVSYMEENVNYASSFCSNFGFSCFRDEITQEDLDAARQEGYEEGRESGEAFGYNQGFAEGATSIDKNALIQSGYEDGYLDGFDEGKAVGKESIDQDAIRQEGYHTGYDAALKDLEKVSIPFFEYCTFSAVVHGITADTGVEYTHTINFVPSVIYSTVSFDSVFVEIQNYVRSNGASWDYVNSVEINMTWEDDFVFDFSIFPLYAIGDYQINSSSIFTPGGFAFNLKLGDLDSEGKRKFELSDFQFGVTVKQIKIAIDNPEDSLLSFELFVPDQFYNDGYINGYSAGFTKGASVDSSSAFNEGYENGYTSGYLIGKEEGLVLVRQGDWKQLFLAVVEAPVNTFQSLFNFEVLGLDMRAAFGSILAICVILIIVKKVIF